ncbi:c-type cytochrome [Burkholderia ubonensis]|uniref:Cytochrome C n=1 Tax=Burkholderia ubonensis subsp. mesacidophila TaxID=265293 RepID=A0A2A4FCX8_9BURK|nr:c-type cytochrome [Burkholderia ubonensis]PCE30478.1 cytochrome C [Burkholderia ubonensis subsp. mesacidophila]
MKKIVLLSIAAIVVVLLGIFGPTLLDLYRLQQFVATTAEANQADGGAWPRLTDACIGCHGAKGTSLHQGYPSLAGQPAAYVAAQLHDFASGQRADPNMAPLAMTMSEDEIKRLADYYAKQPAVANRYFEPDARLRAKGEQLVTAGACAACHGARLTGQAQFPRLAGQGRDYLLKQLDAFAAGTRNEATGTMKRVTAAMSPEDRDAVATYLASVDPAKQ